MNDDDDISLCAKAAGLAKQEPADSNEECNESFTFPLQKPVKPIDSLQIYKALTKKEYPEFLIVDEIAAKRTYNKSELTLQVPSYISDDTITRFAEIVGKNYLKHTNQNLVRQ